LAFVVSSSKSSSDGNIELPIEPAEHLYAGSRAKDGGLKTLSAEK